MQHGHNRVVVRYGISSEGEATLNIMPFVTWRSMHAVRRIEQPALIQIREEGSILIRLEETHFVRMHLHGFRYLEDPDVYRDFLLPGRAAARI